MQVHALAAHTGSSFAAHGKRLQQAEGHLNQLCTDLIPRHHIRERLERRAVELLEPSPTDVVEEVSDQPKGKAICIPRLQRESRCTCRGYIDSHEWRIPGLFSLRAESASDHLPSCPFHLSKKRTARYDVGLEILRLWRSYATHWTLEIVRGAGGSVLKRSMLCKRIVPKNSPAFALLDPNTYGEVYREVLSSVQAVQQLRRRLDDLFRTEQACPTDEMQSGWTLLHVSSFHSCFS